MKTDVAGRVRNVMLPASRPLLPLFEAIVNSIQAIEDAKTNGTISIKLIRDTSPQLFDGDRASRDITGFEITDNGIGFTDENFVAFQTSDTTYKAGRGGKGIGRFVWLVAFDSVEIRSTFSVNGKWRTRSFKFVAQGDGIADELIVDETEGSARTVVRLIGFKEKFRAIAPKGADTVAAYIAEHCLEYLIRPNPVKIELVDATMDEYVDLNSVFEKEMATNSKVVQFKIGDDKFDILHVRLYSSHIKDHLIHFCANNRAVKSDKLIGRVPDLAKRLVDEAGDEFVYAAYLDSSILDATVNPERTDFAISADATGMFRAKMTLEQIRDGALAQARKYLAPFTKPVKDKKEQRIQRFVATEGPMYRPILKYVEEELGMIDPDIGDEELDLQLYKAYHHLEVKLRIEGHELMRGEDHNSEFAHFAAQFEEYFAKVGDVNQADLARYVFHRRLVLEFLQKLLSVQPDGKYPVESRVHQLIFPMRATSNEIPFDQHNLWLLDERLAYHKFLASDKPLCATEPLVNDSQKELDIVVFDKACAFASSSDGPFQTITIIEFKRPMRTSYPDDENPFDQIFEYIERIRSGKARTIAGRDVPVPEGVHFYCYIVADLTAKLGQQASRAGLEKSADGQGFFGFNKPYSAYVEFVSYTKLGTDAKQRNQAFFDKLGLPNYMATPTPQPAARCPPPQHPTGESAQPEVSFPVG